MKTVRKVRETTVKAWSWGVSIRLTGCGLTLHESGRGVNLANRALTNVFQLMGSTKLFTTSAMSSALTRARPIFVGSRSMQVFHLAHWVAMAGRGLWQKLFLYWATQRVISWTTSGDDDKRGRGERKEGLYQQAEIEGYVQERTHGVLRDLLLNISL